MILEKTYLPVINFIYDRIRGMSEKSRKAILIICIVIEVLSTYIYQCDEFMGFMYTAGVGSFIGIICLTGIIIAGIDHKIEKIKVKKWLMYLLMLCGAIIFISGIHHFITYSYMIMGLFMCFMMPAFLIVWCDRSDIDSLFRIIAWVLTVCFVAFVVLNCIFAPVSNPLFFVSGRYFGMASDPNGLAKIAVTASICAIYMMIVKKGIMKLPFAVVFAAAFYLTIMTASRTNLIALALICISAIVFLVKAHVLNKQYNVKKVAVIVCVILVVAGSVFAAASRSDEGSEAGIIETRLLQGVYEDGTINLDILSSGRTYIWKYCLSKTTFIGNDMSEGLQGEGLSVDHVHNTVIELLYRSGIVAGLSFLIIELYCAVWVIRMLLAGRKNTTSEIMASLLLIAFGIASLFDIVVLPFAKMTTFLFCICLAEVFARKSAA